MSIGSNIWRYKATLLTSIYFLIELLAIAFNVTIDRTSWWYKALVITLILLLITTAFSIARKGRTIQ